MYYSSFIFSGGKLMINLKKWLFDHSTEILLTIGITGYAGCMILSAKTYETCKNNIRKKKEELDRELTKKEMISVCWKPCVPLVVGFATSTACIIGSENILLRKNAALAAFAKSTEIAYSELQKEAKAELGEEKYKEIQQKVDQKRAEAETDQLKTLDRKTYLDSNRELYYDHNYGGFFEATETEIFKAFSETNDEIKWEEHACEGDDYKSYVPLNNLYYRLHQGLSIGIGDHMGYPVGQFNKIQYDIPGDYIIAPNGKRAMLIYYDEAVDIP